MLSRFVACSGVGLRCRKRGKALLHGDGADLIRYHAGGRRRVLRFVDRAPDDHCVRPRRDRIGSLSSLGPHPRCQDETVADDSPERPDPVRSGRRRDDACRPGSDRDACELLRELRCELLASGMAEFRDDEDISRACRIDACADGILSREGMTDDAGRSLSDRLLDDEPARVRDVRNLEITQDVAKVRELAHDADARREDERPVHLDSIDVALNRLRDRPRSFDVQDDFDDRYITTLGAKVSKREIVFDMPDRKQIQMDITIWDIMGEKGFRDLLKEAFFHGAKGVLAVADLTRYSTLKELDDWVQGVFKVVGEIPVVYAINKIDLKDEVMILYGDKEIGEATRAFEAPFFYTSAKTGENVELLFQRLGTMVLKREGLSVAS